mmetsp:Transcript_37408/g.105628  ORF Transcript_37408/g.105628 Transcript_37408/m.105628 type:complete len:555 (+) Transcript_37408:84-1748(+)
MALAIIPAVSEALSVVPTVADAAVVPQPSPPEAAEAGAPLDVLVHIDRALDLELRAAMPAGSTVRQLKEQLCLSDPTGEMGPDSFRLMIPGDPARILGDGHAITAALAELDLLSADDAEPPGSVEYVPEPAAADDAAGGGQDDATAPAPAGGEQAEEVASAEADTATVAPDEGSGTEPASAEAEGAAPEGDAGAEPAAGETSAAGPGEKRCAHPKCTYLVHSNSSMIATHCCRKCRETPEDQAPRHGPACEHNDVCPAPVAPDGPERKLFDLLDRSSKGQVSQRDVLMGLKKHPPVRKLFGLPVDNKEQRKGGTLESRLLAIQDAFEAGSGLGELAAAFEALRTGGAEPAGSSFGWEAFAARCQRAPWKQRVKEASAFIHREHSTGPAFLPTSSWQEVPEGATCPAGLEFKMDLSTGKSLARLAPGGSKAVDNPTDGGSARSSPKKSPAPAPAASPPVSPAKPSLIVEQQQWEVVGGVGKGGILVREGLELQSPPTADRLSTGAMVAEVELVGERLHFKRLTGTGPGEGWVSVRLQGKTLMERRGGPSGGVNVD